MISPKQLALGRSNYYNEKNMLIAASFLFYFHIACTILHVTAGGNRGVKQYIYEDIDDGGIADLTSSSKFPDNPDSENTLSEFQSPEKQDDEFGQRLVSYFKAPVTGKYKFYVICDDKCVVNLSTDETEDNKQEIIKFDGKAKKDEWFKTVQQESQVIALTGGKKYFLEALQVDDGGYDIVGVAVRFPNLTYDKPISNQYLYITPDSEEISSSPELTSSLYSSPWFSSLHQIISVADSTVVLSQYFYTPLIMSSSAEKISIVTSSKGSSDQLSIFPSLTLKIMTSSFVAPSVVTPSVVESPVVASSVVTSSIHQPYSMLGGYFILRGHVLLVSPSKRLTEDVNSWTCCALVCLQDIACASFSYKESEKLCFVYHITAKEILENEILNSLEFLHYERIQSFFLGN